MNDLKPTERAYIAGFLDGDGSVFFLDGKYRRPKIVFDQKDPEVLKRIQEMLGYGVLSNTKRNQYGSYWTLRIIRKAEVDHLARALVKYSIVKRRLLRQAIRNLQKPLYP